MLRCLLLVFYLFLSPAKSLAFTPAAPKIRYAITNRTEGRILSVIALQSDEATFANSDTLRTMGDFNSGMIMAEKPSDAFKRYQKIIIQTDQRTFETDTLIYRDRCTAFSVKLSQSGVEISPDYSYKIMMWLRQLLLAILLTYFIKGLPLFLSIGHRFKYVYKEFLLLNGIFAVCFLAALYLAFGGRLGESVERSNVFVYVAILLIAALEMYWYDRRLPQYPIRFMVGIVVGSLLLAFPGYFIMLLGVMLFGGC